MTDAPTARTTEIAAYLAAVERHLGGLPEHVRQDLLTDLDAHLAEVAADLDGESSLADLLGSPEAYARELRETVEVPRERAGTRLRRTFREAAEPLTRRLGVWADRYAVSTGHADAAELRERLRPGWWVLRGVLAALLFLYLFAATQFNATGYNLLGSVFGTLIAIAVILLAVWGSIRLGARTPDLSRNRRRWVGALGLGVVAVAAYQFSWAITGATPVNFTSSYDDGAYYDESAYISDIYVYDEHGEPLTGVYLFDQNGEPLRLGDPDSCPAGPLHDPFGEALEPYETDAIAEDEYRYDEYGENGYQYPLCASQNDPAEATAEASASPEDGVTPTEESTATPTDGVTPTEESTTAPKDTTATPSESPTS